MKTMKQYATLSIAIASLAFAACGGDDCDNGNNGTPDASVDTPKAFPTNIGSQIDRTGRAAISTALIESLLYADSTTQGAGKDSYNGDPEVLSWAATWSPEIQKNLAVLDGLDVADDVNGNPVNGCGNQFGINLGAAPYEALAGILADDQLIIDPTISTCNQYLAVEGGVTTECGGRHPNMDVVETSYSVIAAGIFAGVDDGVASDNVTHSISVFPYLAPPGS